MCAASKPLPKPPMPHGMCQTAHTAAYVRSLLPPPMLGPPLWHTAHARSLPPPLLPTAAHAGPLPRLAALPSWGLQALVAPPWSNSAWPAGVRVEGTCVPSAGSPILPTLRSPCRSRWCSHPASWGFTCPELCDVAKGLPASVPSPEHTKEHACPGKQSGCLTLWLHPLPICHCLQNGVLTSHPGLVVGPLLHCLP